jgi:hydrogenase maturation protein HypF
MWLLPAVLDGDDLGAALESIAECARHGERLRVVVRGAVQGVGFRPFIFRLATELGLPGWVLNSAQGVFIEVEGERAQLHEFLRRLETEKPAISFIQSLEASYLDPIGYHEFEIRESSGGEKTALILPDIATCPECVREINDPANRRYGYPFTNCTNCGPRFTIIESLPYDRARTTMKQFTMCPACAHEYHDPRDRRFHAQPNACPDCGPQVELWSVQGAVLAERRAALLAAAEAIRSGQIVAVKGLGGFHLLADARNEAAVIELRRRKRREEKPLALMFPSVASVLEHCVGSEVELRLLRSVESPIVLLRRKSAGSGDTVSGELSASLAPNNPYLGAMLPYTPLHHLLMQELKFPVVATSGNLSEEPICIDNREAQRRLAHIADCFLVHNRPILRHVDDSIVREMAGRELVLRRARGFAPLPVAADGNLPSLVAVGPHQKNTIAASVGAQVFVSQHIGDLETAESLRAFEQVEAAFRELYELQPVAVACDLHPDYLSTHFARRAKEPAIAVQHHYAHVLACMAENHLRPPVLGVAWDGSGYGTDGTVWGGEFLQVSEAGYRRIAHLRTFSLPGGERAVKEPRRSALGVLYEIFGEEALTLDLPSVRAFTPEEKSVLGSMLAKKVNTPRTSSAGRLFDAVAALIGLRQICQFEGQAAMDLEYTADVPGVEPSYAFELHETAGEMILDWEPMVRAIVAEKRPASSIALAFHYTLASMIVAVAQRAGESRVVLTGGCFQNRCLTELAIDHLRQAGFRAYWHQRIPPNDGGIALGQVIGAAVALRAGEPTPGG